AISSACRTHGFFYLTSHGIPAPTLETVLSLTRRFFLESSDADKDAMRRKGEGEEGGDGARGYQRVGENVTQGRRDWHEAVDLYRGWDDDVSAENSNSNTKSEGRPYELLKGPNLWPQHPPELKQVLEKYIEQVKEVGTKVVRAMGYALELEDPEFFVKKTRESFWVFRLIGYPPLKGRATSKTLDDDLDNGISCGAHTDYGCLTLLLSDPTPSALYVQSHSSTSQTPTWIPADPLPATFVVNIGDMMERWTNGLWKSTVHRVVHRQQNYRVSVPFFFEPDFEAWVEPLPECVERTGGERRWEGVRYGEHLVGKIRGNFY
ncbi:Clavaminate synthase-like protein, partial [Aulographum hederae CBS 113979]